MEQILTLSIAAGSCQAAAGGHWLRAVCDWFNIPAAWPPELCLCSGISQHLLPLARLCPPSAAIAELSASFYPQI